MSEAVVVTTLDIDEPGPMIILVNEAWASLTGVDTERALGATPRILQGSESDRGELDRLREALETDTPYFGQLINYRSDGTAFEMQLFVQTLRPPFGRPFGFVGIERNRSATGSSPEADEAFLARARACAIELAEALTSAEAEGESSSDHAAELALLTRRQREIAMSLIAGRDVFQVAADLGISVDTVRNHRSAIYRRLRVHSQTELMARYRELIRRSEGES